MPSPSGAVLEDNYEGGSSMPSTAVLEYYTFISLDPQMYLERFKFDLQVRSAVLNQL